MYAQWPFLVTCKLGGYGNDLNFYDDIYEWVRLDT